MWRATKYELAPRARDEHILAEQPAVDRLRYDQSSKVELIERGLQLLIAQRSEALGIFAGRHQGILPRSTAPP
jgi:hypothetical protein